MSMSPIHFQDRKTTGFVIIVGVVLFGIGMGWILGITSGDDLMVRYVFGIIFATVGLYLIVTNSLLLAKLPANSKLAGLLYESTNFLEHPNFPKTNATRSRRGNIELHCEGTRVGKFIGLLITGLVFAGIPGGVLIGGAQTITGAGFFLTIFMGIFVLVGLVLLIFAVHALLRILLVGKTHVEIAAEPLQPGQKFRVYLFQEGTFPITSAKLVLVGEEVARWTESSGKSSHTVVRTNRFCEIPIAEGTNLRASNSAPVLIGEGTVPVGAIHSFSTFPCTIRWGIELDLDIPRRPDVKELHQFRVAPIPARKERE